MSTLEELADILGQGHCPAAGALLDFAGPAPRIDVDGFGEIRAPLRPEGVRRLLEFAEPAGYGKGEDTLIDPAVRDTWQIPSGSVTVDWHGRLGDVLDSARRALGLPAACRLRAQFHSLLVYERGQFFVGHQDSQKNDDMVATLVVTLPSPGTGGELLVHDGEATSTYRASRHEATLVVFYADRLHEVRPVRSGHRLTMTYNVLVTGDTRGSVPGDRAGAVAKLLTQHFATPQRPLWGGEATVPSRLAYLLDHEYPSRGLSLRRLKGADAHAAALLGAAAELADCDVVLALTQIHQIRDGEEVDGELIDEEIEVSHWLNAEGVVEAATLPLTGDVAVRTPTVRLRPYAEEYEGYMGNYGETMDRWYRRAALLVWPRRLAFANRAEVGPASAMRDVLVRLQGDDPKAEADLTGLAQTWGDIVASQRTGQRRTAREDADPDLLAATLAAACWIADGDLARRLLAPFSIENLRPEAAAHLVGLAERHGDDWVRTLLGTWFGDQWRFGMAGSAGHWLPELPGLARELTVRPALGRELVALAAGSLRRRLDAELHTPRTESAQQRLMEAGEPLAGVFEAVAVLDAPDLRTEILAWCRREDLVDVLVEALRVARAWPTSLRCAGGTRELADYCIERLRQRLAAPTRAPEDWSVDAPSGCGCDLCVTLGRFLTDPDRRTMEWPLAQPGRQHLHQRIDRAELPVTHVTRRQGRPFTLVLAKTAELFDREQRARELAHRSLDELLRARQRG